MKDYWKAIIAALFIVFGAPLAVGLLCGVEEEKPCVKRTVIYPFLSSKVPTPAGNEPAPMGEEWCEKMRTKHELKQLFAAIAVAEGWNGEDTPGRDGERGRYQITPIWWEDLNRITGEYLPFEPSYYLQDELVGGRMLIYWAKYGAKTPLERASMHNGGPNWKKNQKALAYGKRVVNLMKGK